MHIELRCFFLRVCTLVLKQKWSLSLRPANLALGYCWTPFLVPVPAMAMFTNPDVDEKAARYEVEKVQDDAGTPWEVKFYSALSKLARFRGGD